jgi:molecular chaperone GrpE
MTNGDVPRSEREEASIDGISIKGRADRKESEVKGKRPESEARAGAENDVSAAAGADTHDRETSGKKQKNVQPKAETGTEAPREQSEAPAEIARLSERLEEKEKLAAEYLDLLKRKQADFENFRKRSQKEIDEFKKYATTEVVLDVLNLIDDFERAVEAAKTSGEFDALFDGVQLIRKQLRNLLEKKYGVKDIDAVGQEFDPSKHEAIMVEDSREYEKDTVVEDLRKGYLMHDRIIRPSRVKVARAVEKTADRLGEEPPGFSTRSSLRGADPGARADNVADNSEENNGRGR